MSDEYPYDEAEMMARWRPLVDQTKSALQGVDVSTGESWCAWVCGCGASGDSVASMVEHTKAHDAQDRSSNA